MMKFTENYDNYVFEYQWHAHEILFGLLFEYLKKGQRLLDLGIGTGLSSMYYNILGVDIFGIDNSSEMIEVCKKKRFAKDLKIIDIEKDDFPYESEYFDFVISSGVFHFFKNLNTIFGKISNVIKNDGIFSFTVKDTDNSDSDIVKSFYEEAGVYIYSHSEEYINRLIVRHKFKLLKKQNFLGYNNPSLNEENYYFNVYVLKKA